MRILGSVISEIEWSGDGTPLSPFFSMLEAGASPTGIPPPDSRILRQRRSPALGFLGVAYVG